MSTATIAPFGGGRYQVELRNHQRAKLREIPYRNIQGEWFLGEQGANLRLDIPHRSLGLDFTTLFAGKHEIWVWDSKVATYPIFAGPIVQVTASSRGGLSLNCNDYLWYFSRRLLAVDKVYTGKPEAAMADLLTYTNGLRATGVTAVTDTASATNIAATFRSNDFNQIDDLWSQLAKMGDEVDYYIRHDGASFAPQLHLFGGLKKPTPKTLQLNYPGGALVSYTYQQIATGLANVVYLTGSGAGYSGFGTAVDGTQIANYDARYEKSDAANQNSNASLNKQATQLLKKTSQVIQTPTIVLRSPSYEPWVDFDLGDRFAVAIDDDWTQYSGNVRAVGWQLTVGENDNTTTVIYTNNEAEIT